MQQLKAKAVALAAGTKHTSPLIDLAKVCVKMASEAGVGNLGEPTDDEVYSFLTGDYTTNLCNPPPSRKRARDEDHKEDEDVVFAPNTPKETVADARRRTRAANKSRDKKKAEASESSAYVPAMDKGKQAAVERYSDKTGPYAVEVSNFGTPVGEREYKDGACRRCIGSIANTRPRFSQCNARLAKHQGQIRVMATKPIRNGQEIFVWYGDEYELNVPGVQFATTAK